MTCLFFHPKLQFLTISLLSLCHWWQNNNRRLFSQQYQLPLKPVRKSQFLPLIPITKAEIICSLCCVSFTFWFIWCFADRLVRKNGILNYEEKIWGTLLIDNSPGSLTEEKAGASVRLLKSTINLNSVSHTSYSAICKQYLEERSCYFAMLKQCIHLLQMFSLHYSGRWL